VFEVLKRDSRILINSTVSVSTENLDKTVFSDSKWLEFIIHQLIINAVKYSNKSQPSISIRADELMNSCVLKVTDNGMGIPENELHRIFDKGFTGTNGRIKGKSTGMGLYICKNLCEKLGISLMAESLPGSYTTISIIFPKSSMTGIVGQ
jgi:signal transduction histidine kinase